MTSCNFDVYCENGVLKGDGLCFAQCCITGNVCDACKKITYKYFVKDSRVKIVIGVTYGSLALDCPLPPDLGIPGSWECVEFKEPNYPYTITERRCLFVGTECLCNIPDGLIEELRGIIEASCDKFFGPARIDVAGTEFCCVGCCKPINGDTPFAATSFDCRNFTDVYFGRGSSGDNQFYPCGCNELGEPIINGDCSYEEPGGKIGGCCSKAEIAYELLNPECSGINTVGTGDCPEFIQLSKLCNKEPEDVLVNPEGFPDYCNIQPSEPRTIDIDPEILFPVDDPTSDCCEITCCSGGCPTLTTSILRKKIIGNRLKLKLNKKEIIRRIRKNIRKRRIR